MASDHGLEFADDLLGCCLWDQVSLDLELKDLLEERSSLLARDAQCGGIVGRTTVRFCEPKAIELVTNLAFNG